MSGYLTWMIYVQIGIFVMGTGSLATWLMLSRSQNEPQTEENRTH